MSLLRLAFGPRAVALVGLALVALASSGCQKAGGPGARCYKDSDCVDGAACFTLDGSESVCMYTCTGDSTFCPGGEVCIPTDTDPDIHACLVGGDVIIGDQCTVSRDCEKGGVCVFIPAADARYCRLACEPTADGYPCAPSLGQTCVGECAAGVVGFCSIDPAATPACPPDAGAPDAGASDAGP